MARKLVYEVDDIPPPPVLLLAGAQHVLTLFGATTLVPLLLGPKMGMTPADMGFFVSCVYFCMGIATLIQTSRIGSELPIVQGSSFSFIPPILTVIGIYGTNSPSEIMQYIGGGLIVGGVVLGLIGYLGIAGLIKRFVGPITIGPTIMAIGFSLAPTAIGSASGSWPVSLSVLALIFIFSLIVRAKYINIFSILLSVVIVYGVCLFLSSSGTFRAGDAAFISLANVESAEWFKFTGFAPWGMPKFAGPAIAAMAAGFLAVFIESIGDYYNVSNAAGLEDPSRATINKGIGSEGLGCIIGGLFGGVGCTSYTENIGLIGLTGVASRWVVRVGAIFLIVMSLVGKLGVLIASIPTPIIGGCYIALFGVIGALGIQALMRADMYSQRNVMIVGFSFLMALGLPSWVEANQSLFMTWGTAGEILWALGKTHMAVAGILACLLDNIVPGTKEERGFK